MSAAAAAAAGGGGHGDEGADRDDRAAPRPITRQSISDMSPSVVLLLTDVHS